MAVLSRRLGPLPMWAYIAIVVIGGVVFYLWWRHYTNSNAANQAQSTSGIAGANPAYDPLNPTNDPNIDPNTGVPYQLEEATNPATGAPYYYSSPTSSPPPSTTTTPVVTPPTSSGGEQIPAGGKGYTFQTVGNTGQTNHLYNVAMQEYGVTGTSATNAATQAIINANPSLQGKSYTYQPPVGTRIVIPQR
jgi:hypothetical protein